VTPASWTFSEGVWCEFIGVSLSLGFLLSRVLSHIFASENLRLWNSYKTTIILTNSRALKSPNCFYICLLILCCPYCVMIGADYLLCLQGPRSEIKWYFQDYIGCGESCLSSRPQAACQWGCRHVLMSVLLWTKANLCCKFVQTHPVYTYFTLLPSHP
jgi:hypothetical protein